MMKLKGGEQLIATGRHWMHRDSMARRWCGFLPQNQEAKEQWELLEATKIEIEGKLEQFPWEETPERIEQQEGEELCLLRMRRAH